MSSRSSYSRDKTGRKLGRTVLNAVQGFLGERGPEGATAKEIAKATKLSPPSVYRAIGVLRRENLVQPFGWGLYRTLVQPGEMLSSSKGRIGAHGLVFKGENYPLRPHETGQSATDEPMPLGSFGVWKRVGRCRWRIVTEFHRRTVRFVWHSGKRTLMAYCATTKHPLIFSELPQLRGWMEAKCSPVNPGTALDIVEGSLAVDYKGASIQWGKALKYAAWDNGFLQLYEKILDQERHLRLEVQWAKEKDRHLPFEKGMETLISMDPDVQVARAAQKEAEAKIAQAKAEQERIKWEREQAEKAKAAKEAAEKGIPAQQLGVDSYPTGYG